MFRSEIENEALCRLLGRKMEVLYLQLTGRVIAEHYAGISTVLRADAKSNVACIAFEKFVCLTLSVKKSSDAHLLAEQTRAQENRFFFNDCVADHIDLLARYIASS